MVATLRIGVIAITILLGFESIAEPSKPAPDKIVLHAGETTTLSFPKFASINISRRGVVELFHVGGDEWSLTGLRKGLIALRATWEAPEGMRSKRLLIQVLSAPEPADLSLHFPKSICQTGLTCDARHHRISGLGRNLEDFWSAQTWCENSKGCRFTARLAEAARAKWQKDLEVVLGPKAKVHVSDKGRAHATVYCPSKRRHEVMERLEFLTDHAISNGMLLVTCLGDQDPEHYRLRGNIFLVEKQRAESLGFLANPALTWSAFPIKGIAELEATLRSMAEKRQAVILGEPLLELLAGTPAKVASGGEFQTIVSGEDHRSTAKWKRYGFELQVKAVPKDPDTVNLDYEISLKSRSRGGAVPNLKINHVESSAELRFGEPAVVAVIDVSTRDDGREQNSLLSGVPIIGPLFSVESAERLDSKMIVSFNIDRHPGQLLSP